MRQFSKVYLGDAVYAQQRDDGAIVLTTENGLTATNTIVLEPEVLDGLIEFFAHLARKPER